MRMKKFMIPFDDLMNQLRRLDHTVYMIMCRNEMADEKCPYCDNERMITLTAPNGQSARVPCNCGKKKVRVYYYVPCRCVSLKIDSHQIALKYSYKGMEYSRRHDSMIDPDPGKVSIFGDNFVNMSFTTPEKAREFIAEQGWKFSQELTDKATEEAERYEKEEIKEGLRPAVQDKKLMEKLEKNGVFVE